MLFLICFILSQELIFPRIFLKKKKKQKGWNLPTILNKEKTDFDAFTVIPAIMIYVTS